ncbi:Arm DNA-binding domain-containing protein [Flavobacterium sp. P21]|uniref:Arm DNA-binding domain-containing protein n=1 Tax=Flavobacterium sp. P21 TaxID=3423948 RepID=UPI003D676F47
MNYAREQLWVDFLLKAPRHNESNIRSVYFRITVDGIPKEASTRRQWDTERWNKKTERATGTKEDAKSLNFFWIHSLRKSMKSKPKLCTPENL